MPRLFACRVAGRAARTLTPTIAAGLVVVLSPSPGLAQATTGGDARGAIARTFEFNAREGLRRQLEEGYRRHLDWHLQAGDRWAWYLWQVTNGERAGLYVDGTFRHSWSDFDAAVDPPGDAADNAANVNPFAMRGANHVWRLRRDLGPASDAAPVNLGAALVLRTEYRLRSGADSAFARTMHQLRAAAGGRPYAVYELVSGGELPTYVVWVPAETWADAGAFADRTAAAARALADVAEQVRSELWRFRPDLSICSRSDADCYRTLP